MIEFIININTSEIIKILILSMLPITELRLSIPVGILLMKVHWFQVVVVSLTGNVLIGIIILYFIEPIFTILKKFKHLNNLISTILTRTRKRGKIIDNLKYYGLIIFVSIPLPLSGVWTGALAAYIFGLSKNKSILAIFFGAIISSLLVTFLTITGKYLFI